MQSASRVQNFSIQIMFALPEKKLEGQLLKNFKSNFYSNHIEILVIIKICVHHFQVILNWLADPFLHYVLLLYQKCFRMLNTFPGSLYTSLLFFFSYFPNIFLFLFLLCTCTSRSFTYTLYIYGRTVASYTRMK
jgi:hypothetical protein